MTHREVLTGGRKMTGSNNCKDAENLKALLELKMCFGWACVCVIVWKYSISMIRVYPSVLPCFLLKRWRWIKGYPDKLLHGLIVLWFVTTHFICSSIQKAQKCWSCRMRFLRFTWCVSECMLILYLYIAYWAWICIADWNCTVCSYSH